jgi:hypothetical protein
VTSSASPGCVAEFVMDQIYYPEARIGIGYVTPEQFVKAVWGFTDPWGDQPGRHLIDCFLKARGDSTRLVTDDGWVCDVERINGVWKIADFYLGD